jgi:predicted HAD superfamily Cof-like phosphohydrolase
MKTDHQKRIEEMMIKAGQEVPKAPMLPSEKVRELRANLIYEEAMETIQALGCSIDHSTGRAKVTGPCDMIGVADGCADLSVVTIGTLSAFGIADEPLLEVVDLSNLDKFRGDAHRREDGKWIKPSDWQPPNIKGVLECLRQ